MPADAPESSHKLVLSIDGGIWAGYAKPSIAPGAIALGVFVVSVMVSLSDFYYCT